MKKKIAIIGSGFSGLSAACFLAKDGHDITVFEKNETAGGRARNFKAGDFLFDMGPSWYWMPDVFDRFFENFGKQTSDFYKLEKLDPGFRMIFGKNDHFDISADIKSVYQLFDEQEINGAVKLQKFLSEAQKKYNTSFAHFIYKPSEKITEFISAGVFKSMFRLDVFNSFSKHVRKYFTNEKLLKILEFPILFLGGSPQKIPSLYSLMNHAALNQGTFYPEGGFYKIIEGMISIAESYGAQIKTGEQIIKINAEKNIVKELVTNKSTYKFDAVIASGDYAHIEQLLDKKYRNYSDNYWQKKTFSPSSLIFYLGINKKVDGLQHHNLFFDESLEAHSDSIYKTKTWPEKPLFYVCCPSKTDTTVAPAGNENLFVLMPLAVGVNDDENAREKYFKIMMERLENITGQQITNSIIFKKSYCVTDFERDYNAYKGNAYGLANTLMQTAFLKPKIRNKKLKNLYYCGQLTVPGPGVPPALISGQLAAKQLIKNLKF